MTFQKNSFVGLIALVFALFLAPVVNAQATASPIPLGAAVALSVTSEGTAPFTYQWSKNGVQIPGATAGVYSIPSFNLTFSGTYSVVVSNSAGSDTAPGVVIAILTIKPSNSKIGVAVVTAPPVVATTKP